MKPSIHPPSPSPCYPLREGEKWMMQISLLVRIINFISQNLKISSNHPPPQVKVTKHTPLPHFPYFTSFAPQILQNLFLFIYSRYYSRLKRNLKQWFCKILGANKVHCGKCGSGDLLHCTFDKPLIRLSWRPIANKTFIRCRTRTDLPLKIKALKTLRLGRLNYCKTCA